MITRTSTYIFGANKLQESLAALGRDQGVAALDTRAIDHPASLDTAKGELRLTDITGEQGKD